MNERPDLGPSETEAERYARKRDEYIARHTDDQTIGDAIRRLRSQFAHGLGRANTWMILFLAILLFLEGVIAWGHYTLWFRSYDYNPDDTIFAIIFGAVSVLFVLAAWHSAFEIRYAKTPSGRVSWVIAALTLTALAAFYLKNEYRVFFDTLTMDTTDMFGNLVPGLTPEQANARIYPWFLANLGVGGITGWASTRCVRR